VIVLATTGIVSGELSGDGLEVAPVAELRYTYLYCVSCLTLAGSGGMIVGDANGVGDACNSKILPE
jgi:hypothetical protein